MHAWTALKMGDPTARDLGRITLNPMSHFEPFGFFGMVMISIGIPFIGWGKPVPVNPSRFTHSFARHRKRGMALVAFAGPLSNVAQALLMAIPYQLWARGTIELNQGAVLFMTSFITVNVLLASFNMIPIPPLDGHKILMGILPDFWRPILAPLEQYGFVVLLLLFFVGGQLGGSLVNGIMLPVREVIYNAVNLGL
ncbi:MAG: site-2 protease family protein [Chloroflexia bacterium]|nr:site-2 protease family protein [Chloroflexia bacterium]